MRKGSTKYTKDRLAPILSNCNNWHDAMKELGLRFNSSGRLRLARLARTYKLSFEHFVHRKKGKNVTSDSEIFALNSGFSPSYVKKRLLRTKQKPYICAICKATPIWHGAPLSLILDHIDGNAIDHRLENLRFVCPNCNSQLPTFCGRNIRDKRVILT